MNKNIIFLAIALVSLTSVAVAGGILFFTNRGAGLLTRGALQKYFASEHFEIEEIRGALSQEVFYENIQITHLRGFPKGTILKIQKIRFSLNSLSLDGLHLEIENGRIQFPLSEPVVFHGVFKNGILNFNVFSNSIDVEELLSLGRQNKQLRYYWGTINNIDLYLQGDIKDPQINGKFFVDRLNREDFSLTSAPGQLNVMLKNISEELHFFGKLLIDEGTLAFQSTRIALEPSRFLFSGPLKSTKFDLHGNSKIGHTSIDVTLKGTVDQPDLNLFSEPPLPQPQLLLLLATGKRWEGMDALNQGQLSPDLARDFIDYFIFAGQGSKISQMLGISDFSLKFDKQTKGFGLKKDLTDKAGIGYGIEQSEEEPGKTAVTQNLEGEYRLTGHLSIDMEKKIRQEYEATPSLEEPNQPKTDDKILLKYKTRF